MKKIIHIILLLALLIGFNYFIYSYLFPNPTPVNPSLTIPSKENNITINLAATGDILMHNTVLASGKVGINDYNYDHLFAPIKHISSQADYATISLEAVMAGAEYGYTGYPLFNTPDSTATALKASGFDFVSITGNHCMDRGLKGTLRSLEVIKNSGLDTTGVFASAQEKDQYLIKDIKGIKVGFVAYTYGTNAIPIPNNTPYLVNILNPQAVQKDITALKPQVDLLVLLPHWGVEYNHYPTEEQQKMALSWLENGADIILGSHPHVIQPAQLLNINGQKKFVIYSMGNSLGHQRGNERNSGVIVNLKITKNLSTSQTTIDEANYIPTFSHSYKNEGRQLFRVVPIDETIAKIKSGEELYFTTADIPLLEEVRQNTLNYLNAMNES